MNGELEPGHQGEIHPGSAQPGKHGLTARELAARARAVRDTARQTANVEPRTGPTPRGLRDPLSTFREEAAQDPRTQPVAVVLAGGGARGAYQAGVVSYLAEVGAPVAAVSGASIGALNGAVVAAAPSLEVGAQRLIELWRQVAEQTGQAPFGTGQLTDSTLTQYLNLRHHLSGPMLRPGFLDDLVAQHVDVEALRTGTPMWVSVFPAIDPDFGSLRRLLPKAVWAPDGPLRAGGRLRFGWAVDVVRGSVLKRPAEWIKVNELAPDAVHNAILTSAAVPVVLPPRSIDGRVYRDGGLGDNVPVGALCRQTGCRRVVVVHLEPLPLLNPNRYPEVDIIEVIPSRGVSPSGPLGWATSLFDLSPRRVAELAELGHSDAREQLGRHWRQEAAEQIYSFMDGFRRDAVAELDEPLDT